MQNLTVNAMMECYEPFKEYFELCNSFRTDEIDFPESPIPNHLEETSSMTGSCSVLGYEGNGSAMVDSSRPVLGRQKVKGRENGVNDVPNHTNREPSTSFSVDQPPPTIAGHNRAVSKPVDINTPSNNTSNGGVWSIGYDACPIWNEMPLHGNSISNGVANKVRNGASNAIEYNPDSNWSEVPSNNCYNAATNITNGHTNSMGYNSDPTWNGLPQPSRSCGTSNLSTPARHMDSPRTPDALTSTGFFNYHGLDMGNFDNALGTNNNIQTNSFISPSRYENDPAPQFNSQTDDQRKCSPCSWDINGFGYGSDEAMSFKSPTPPSNGHVTQQSTRSHLNKFVNGSQSFSPDGHVDYVTQLVQQFLQQNRNQGNGNQGYDGFLGNRGNRALEEGKHCAFCKRNRETEEFYTTHVVKDCRGKVICPILRKYVCPICHSTGDNAHTLRHCPFRVFRP